MSMVVYSDGLEVIVCEKKDEKSLLEQYFEKGGRDLEEFDRSETSSSRKFVHMHSTIHDNTE